ncbi:GNAT family N-acetyltransferase [Denitratisoma oestradiolicum]|uniref:L-ornithine N(alpha)-acyltransferase n=1 Tax=Denitratisoma oestradiolicum TaxID=311182 RepID=A0A6S6Y8E3_9PROT|nr:GNAT family N-acyltransferase [Denitratisoma oestradiolicum]TWO81521.1 GNAT family N-acetyltransferase [Denitratisoma oestradiolicum]CAB1368738.1 GNAT family N-acetyltransferase [Denitratisoma oestradiolicum]
MLNEGLGRSPHIHRPHYHVGLARSESEIREAQKLRYRVFAEEMGARLETAEPGVDADHFDPHCEHLIVRDEARGRIVGTYRILTPEGARNTAGYYSETEFDIGRLNHLRPRLVEVGRSCIDPEYRSGAVIALLWARLAEYMVSQGYEYLMGCASISMADGGHNASNLFVELIDQHLSPIEYRGFPHSRLPYHRLVTGRPAEVPPLVKGYLRAGAWICGDPAWDPDFNTADLLVLLPMNRINLRYMKHFVNTQGRQHHPRG